MFTLTLKKPIKVNGESVDKLEFDFDRLTGKDMLDMEAEILMTGGAIASVPEVTSSYQSHLAVKACRTDGVGMAELLSMSAVDFRRLCRKSRNFILGAGEAETGSAAKP